MSFIMSSKEICIHCSATKVTCLETSCCSSGFDNDCHMRLGMVLISLLKCFESMTDQTYAKSCYKSDKVTDVVRRACIQFLKVCQMYVEKDLNQGFLMAISVRKFCEILL